MKLKNRKKIATVCFIAVIAGIPMSLKCYNAIDYKGTVVWLSVALFGLVFGVVNGTPQEGDN